MRDLAAKNIELKARLPSIDAARRIARDLTGQSPQIELQTDTYFHCARGRLKLRETGDRQAQLIAYERADTTVARASDYRIVAINDPVMLKAALASVLGVRTVVAKRREIYLLGNVRIHLDEIAGLGEFLEFEAVLSPSDDEHTAEKLVSQLAERFGISAGAIVAESYVDLASAQVPDHRGVRT